jgi:hypothetical protein
VRYDHLNIDALAHVGNRGLPTFINTTLNSLEVRTYGSPENFLTTMSRLFFKSDLFLRTFFLLQSIANLLHIIPNNKVPMNILHDINGIIKPKR